jgi:hypothetical protein
MKAIRIARAFGAALCLVFLGIIAHAAVGTAPGTGFQLVDGAWLNGLAGGLNNTYQSGLTAAGTTQATATQIPSGIYLVEVDTAAASTGVNLPPCLPGTELNLYNNGANTLSVYPAVANNPVTAAQDTINNGTSLSGGMATHTAEFFFCAKAGVWAAK